VTWQIERQIRLAYDQLGGGAELPPQEARRALEAVEAYLGAPGRPMFGQVLLPPRLAGDLAETPIRSGRRPAPEGIKLGAGMRGLALVALVGAIIEARRHGALADDARPIVLLEDAEAHLPVKQRSKPGMALAVLEAANSPDDLGCPPLCAV
jgi:hypothetical protein